MPAESPTPSARRWWHRPARYFRIARIQTRRFFHRVGRTRAARGVRHRLAPCGQWFRAVSIHSRRAVHSGWRGARHFWRDQHSTAIVAAPFVAVASGLSRFRAWIVNSVTRMDGETWAWSAATATGVIALLLMLAWHFTNMQTISADAVVENAEAAKTDVETNHAKAAPDAPRLDNAVVANTPQAEPPVIEKQPDIDPQPRFRGFKLIGRSPFGDPPQNTEPPVNEPPVNQPPVNKAPTPKQVAVEPPVKERSPFEVEPKTSEPKIDLKSPFGHPTPKNVAQEPPPTASPFGPAETNQPDKQPVVKSPTLTFPPAKKTPEPKAVVGVPMPEATNPFSEPEPKVVRREKPPAFQSGFPDTTPKPGHVARPKPNDDRESLTVDIVRFNPPLLPQRDDSFLVTSLGKANENLKRDSIAGNERTVESDGWNVVAMKNPRNTIIPTWHGVGQPASNSIAGSASIATRWAVDAPRLRFEIIVAPRGTVGESLPIQLRVTNTGSAAATGVKLLIDLPATLTYHVGRKLEHKVGRLEPGTTRTARLTPKVVASGAIDLAAVAVADDGLRLPAEQQVATHAGSQSGPQTATAEPASPETRLPRPKTPMPARRTIVECYDGQRIILIRR